MDMTSSGKIFITDHGFKDIEQEQALLKQAGYMVHARKRSTEDELIAEGADAVALLVQWAPLTANVIDRLDCCRIIVRYGIGVDNVDLDAAKKKGIPVCNIPDYCIHEVADHTISMALSLARQLVETNEQLLRGKWEIVPPRPMPAFRDMLFATLGYGRIAREVLARAEVFNFTLGTYDPYLADDLLREQGVKPLSFDELIATADILSLHLPLSQHTHHIINRDVIAKMKPGAILINTSRGGLVDTVALALAIEQGKIVAGIDVFETEPLPLNHPLRDTSHVLLTSHTAWYSERSVPTLQRMAAEEVLRGLSGHPLKNRVA